jgi:hypothetical protein
VIRRHDFNTAWWGEEVGIIDDTAFFELSTDARAAALQPFAWAELVQPLSRLPARRRLAEAGFFHADTQVRFRLDLRRVRTSPSAAELAVERADVTPFGVAPKEMRPFLHERFYTLPGADAARVTARYARWSAELIRDHPRTCRRFLREGRVQGWFLAQPEGSTVNLALAMLAAEAVTSGYDVYARAATEFAGLGFHIGWASFSVSNTAVQNIYASLGARFVEPREYWMWIRARP